MVDRRQSRSSVSSSRRAGAHSSDSEQCTRAADIERRAGISAAIYRKVSNEYTIWEVGDALKTMQPRVSNGRAVPEALVDALEERVRLEKLVADMYGEWASKWQTALTPKRMPPLLPL